MSEERQKTNFWTTLPGILTGIAAVIVAIGGLITGIIELNKPREDRTEKQPVIETLYVAAKDTDGESYRNNTDKPVKVNFTAKGEWLAIPKNVNANVPNKAKGRLSPDGAAQVESNPDIPCPDLPLGALVVKIKSGCPAYGKDGSFDLGREETASFLMNDVQDLYGDNEGNITVELSIE